MTSLEVLNPTRIGYPAKTTEKTSTAHELERASIHIAGCISAQAWSDPAFEYLATNMRTDMDFDMIPAICTREQYVQNYQAVVAMHPDYRNEVSGVYTVVNEQSGLAQVWMVVKVFNVPKPVVMEHVSIAYWRRLGGAWQAYKQSAFRSMEMGTF